jgi:hypothetical protein
LRRSAQRSSQPPFAIVFRVQSLAGRTDFCGETLVLGFEGAISPFHLPPNNSPSDPRHDRQGEEEDCDRNDS